MKRASASSHLMMVALMYSFITAQLKEADTVHFRKISALSSRSPKAKRAHRPQTSTRSSLSVTTKPRLIEAGFSFSQVSLVKMLTPSLSWWLDARKLVEQLVCLAKMLVQRMQFVVLTTRQPNSHNQHPPNLLSQIQ